MNSKGKLLVLLSVVLFTLVCFTAVNAATAWAPNTYYAVGTIVTYNGYDYQCIQAHTSLVGWEPPNTPALWQLIGPSGSVSPAATPTATKTPTPTTTPSGVTPTATKTPTADPNAVVNLYQNTYYGGWQAGFGVGNYLMADLIAKGGVNDDASSIKVTSGYKAIVYADNNFGGASLTKTADDNNLIDDNFNDQISSLKVVPNLTQGWTAQAYTYDYHTPPNVPLADRYQYDSATKTHHFLVYSTDTPRFEGTSPRTELRFKEEWTSGEHQFEADIKVASGTDDSSIVQVFGGANGHATAFMMWAHNESGGAFKRYDSQVLLTGIYDKWYHLNLIHNANTNTVYVYLDGALKGTFADWGDATHYFKCGVYGVVGTKSESWIRDIRIWYR